MPSSCNISTIVSLKKKTKSQGNSLVSQSPFVNTMPDIKIALKNESRKALYYFTNKY